MAHWGRRIEFSKDETKALLDAVAHQLIRDIHHHAIDADLVNVLKKTTQTLNKFNENECPFEEDK